MAFSGIQEHMGCSQKKEFLVQEHFVFSYRKNPDLRTHAVLRWEKSGI